MEFDIKDMAYSSLDWERHLSENQLVLNQNNKAEQEQLSKGV